MTDITREEAEQFNDDVQCVIERLKEFDLVVDKDEYNFYIANENDPEVSLASSAITRQLFHRWFGIEYSLSNMERIRFLRKLIAKMNAAEDSAQLPASDQHPHP